MNPISFPFIQPIKFIALTWWFTTGILISKTTCARECRFYTNSAGRRRRMCYGLLPGIIAAVIVGVIVLLAFASLAWILRRRRQRAHLQDHPVFTHESIDNLMRQQPPSYPPPPNYPLEAIRNEPIDPPGGHDSEKHQPIINNPVQVPPRANLHPDPTTQ